MNTPGDHGGERARPRSGSLHRVPAWQRPVLGAFAVLMGTFIVLATLGLGPMAGSTINAPRWVVGLGGLFFILCGLLLLRPRGRLGRLLERIAVAGFTAVFAWVALYADAPQLVTEPGILPQDMRVIIARAMFGIVAVIGALITGRGLWLLLRASRSRRR